LNGQEKRPVVALLLLGLHFSLKRLKESIAAVE